MSVSAPSVSEPSALAPRDLILLLAINLIWGFNLIASKVGVDAFPPILFTAMRFGLLALVLAPLLRWHREQMSAIATIAFFTGALHFALLFVGLRLSGDVSTVAIATQLGVPISTLLSVWLLGERIRWRRTLGIMLAFGGVVVIGFDPRVFSYWQGLLLVIASTALASAGLIYFKRLRNVRALDLQAWIAMLSWPPLLLLSLLAEDGQWTSIHNAGVLQWAALAYTVLITSLIAHTGWFYLVGKYQVTSVAPLTLLSPLCGIFFGVTILDDHLTSRMLVGGAITLTGVLIVMLREKKLVDVGT